MKKINSSILIVSLLAITGLQANIYNMPVFSEKELMVYQQIKSSILTKNINEFKNIIEKGDSKYTNIYNETCMTPLALAYSEIQNANLTNIDKIINMIKILKKKKAFKFNNAEKATCLKEYKQINKKPDNLTDAQILRKQLLKFKNKKEITHYTGRTATLNKLDEILSKFNNSDFAKDGNYIKMTIKNNNTVAINMDVQIADWSLSKHNGYLNINQDVNKLINNINIYEMVKELNFLFKNQTYINQIIIMTNREFDKLENNRNPIEVKKIKNKILSYKSSYDYLVKGNTKQLKMLKKIFTNIK